jgi:TRAP-type C4-dicarboxylate transport system permease small subunit
VRLVGQGTSPQAHHFSIGPGEGVVTLLKLADRIVRQLTRWAFMAGASLLLVLALIGFVDVVMTNTILVPVRGLVEISGSLLAVVVFLGLAQAQAQGANITIDIFTQMMPPLLRRLSDVVTLAICTAFMAALAWYTAALALAAWHYNETALGAFAFPMAPGKTLAFIGAAIAMLEFARQLVRRAFTSTPSESARP